MICNAIKSNKEATGILNFIFECYNSFIYKELHY